MKRTNEVANKVGVSKRTLQYYDDEGLLGLERNVNNYRIFNQETMERIWKILLYKEMDFTLAEIKQILDSTEEEKQNYLEQQTTVLQNHILDLRVKIKLISEVKQNSLLGFSDEQNEFTYKKRIVQMLEKMRNEL